MISDEIFTSLMENSNDIEEILEGDDYNKIIDKIKSIFSKDKISDNDSNVFFTALDSFNTKNHGHKPSKIIGSFIGKISRDKFISNDQNRYKEVK